MTGGTVDPSAVPVHDAARVSHVGVTVSDLERSVAFYRDVIGLALERVTPPIEEEWFDTLTENPGSQVCSAMFVDGDVRLQLVKYHKGGSTPASVGHAVTGNAHLCIRVHDLDARYHALVSEGTYRVSPVVDIAGTGDRSFYVYDPDGVPVELQQIVEEGARAAG